MLKVKVFETTSKELIGFQAEGIDAVVETLEQERPDSSFWVGKSIDSLIMELKHIGFTDELIQELNESQHIKFYRVKGMAYIMEGVDF